jgi:hypothetical protein
MSGFPGVVGAIDGSHIPIKAPTKYPADYFNRKHFYSIVLQAVCDHDGKFIDVFVGFPGSVHDSRILRNSTIFQQFNNNRLTNLPQNSFILGDSGYPIQNWLLTPYRDNGHLQPQQKYYNYRHSQTRIKIEQSFGKLKTRWRCLMKRLEVSVEVAPHIVMACCILHNICEEKLDFLDYDEIIQDPHHFDDIDHEQEENNVQRDFICNLLWSQRVSNN